MVEVEAAILQQLITGLNSPTQQVKTFYQGKVATPPRDLLPCLMLWGSNTTAGTAAAPRGDTRNDWAKFNMNIRVMYSLRDIQLDTGTPTESGVRVLQGPLLFKNLIEGRDPTTGGWLPHTVIGTLRNKQNIIGGVTYSFNNTFLINYQQLDKPDMPLIWADISFSVEVYGIKRPGF